jgi:hypothetical protein
MKWLNRCALLLTLIVLPVCSAFAEFANDYCGDGDGGAGDFGNYVIPDEPALSGWLEEIDGDLFATVELVVCSANPDKKTKYQVHLDHTPPLATDGACADEQDDTLTWRETKATGPGAFYYDDEFEAFDVGLYYAIFNLSELNPGIGIGDTVALWATAKNRGVMDRVPDTDGSDGCSEPQTPGEVVSLRVPCFLGAGITVDNTTEAGAEFAAIEASMGPLITGPVSGELKSVGRACTGEGDDIAPAENSSDIALISRGSCAFSEKINDAEAAGYAAVIVYNSPGENDLIRMVGPPTAIPAVNIGNSDGGMLEDLITNESPVNVTLFSNCFPD